MAVIHTKYGRVAEPTGACKDNYPLIETLHREGMIVKLQEGAMESYKEACRRYRIRTWPKRDNLAFRPIMLTGSWRSCRLQTELWHSDPGRFADPSTSLHCRGLAIDVVNPVPSIVHSILMAHGWHQARPDDEPWHFSYHFEA